MRRARRRRARASLRTADAEAHEARRVHRASPRRREPRRRLAPVVLAGCDRPRTPRHRRGSGRGRRAYPTPGGGCRHTPRDHHEARRRRPPRAVAGAAPPSSGDGIRRRVVAGGVPSAEDRGEGGVHATAARRGHGGRGGVVARASERVDRLGAAARGAGGTGRDHGRRFKRRRGWYTRRGPVANYSRGRRGRGRDRTRAGAPARDVVGNRRGGRL